MKQIAQVESLKNRGPCMMLPLARMALTFGPGTADADAGRRIKQMVRDAVEGSDTGRGKGTGKVGGK